MKSTVEYIAQLLNIKTDSELVVMDIMAELSQINVNDFVEFLKQNFNYAGIEYQTGFQKFMSLVKIYKRQKANIDNSDKINDAMTFAQKLCLKVKSVSSDTIFTPTLDFANFVHSDTKEPYFTEIEIKTLQRIGNLYKCVMLQKSESGTDKLLEAMGTRIEARYSGEQPKQLTNPKMNKLLNTGVKKI